MSAKACKNRKDIITTLIWNLVISLENPTNFLWIVKQYLENGMILVLHETFRCLLLYLY